MAGQHGRAAQKGPWPARVISSNLRVDHLLDRGQLSRQQVAVLGQHVGHHDSREVHGLVGVGREQSVGCQAVAQRVVAGFVVPQVQEGWFREVGRGYRGDLIVFVALVLAIVGLAG